MVYLSSNQFDRLITDLWWLMIFPLRNEFYYSCIIERARLAFDAQTASSFNENVDFDSIFAHSLIVIIQFSWQFTMIPVSVFSF